MPRSDVWKPCGSLRPDDFTRHPLWGFDLSREEEPGADETWVRPYRLDVAPRTSDVLFVSAMLTFAGGGGAPGTITFVFRDGVPAIEDVMLLSPSYLPTSAGGRGPLAMQSFIERRLAATLGRPVAQIYPIADEGRVPIGRGAVDLRGTVESGGAA